jgi:serine/threonine protein kinase
MSGLGQGTVLANTYRIERCVGRGGMGEVYEASHARLAGRYAVKLLLADVRGRPELFARFKREAEVTSGLRHPNIVHVVDFNMTDEGYPYLVMEFLDGIDLAAEIEARAPLPLPRVVDLVAQVGSALTAAHAHRVVHRDLKPHNLVLVRLPGDGREVVKVVDFGISKVREATTKITQESTVMGTPHYMAPEQALGRIDEIDARTDQFALAAIAYEALTGHEPFRGQSPSAVLYQVVHEEPPPMLRYNPLLPPAVEAVIRRGLAKRREERFASVRELCAELEWAARDERTVIEDGSILRGIEDRTVVVDERMIVDVAGPRPGRTETLPGLGRITRAIPFLARRRPTTLHGATGELAARQTPGSWWRRRELQIGAGAAIGGGVVALTLAVALSPASRPTERPRSTARGTPAASHPAASAPPASLPGWQPLAGAPASGVPAPVQGRRRLVERRGSRDAGVPAAPPRGPTAPPARNRVDELHDPFTE